MMRELDLEQDDHRESPAVRLRNLILTEGLRSGARALRLQVMSQDRGQVECEIGGSWQPIMQIPIQPFRHVAGSLKDAAKLGGTDSSEVPVRFQGASRRLALRTENPGEVNEVLTLSIPAESAT
jgi:hypothetical protein